MHLLTSVLDSATKVVMLKVVRAPYRARETKIFTQNFMSAPRVGAHESRRVGSNPARFVLNITDKYCVRMILCG